MRSAGKDINLCIFVPKQQTKLFFSWDASTVGGKQVKEGNLFCLSIPCHAWKWLDRMSPHPLSYRKYVCVFPVLWNYWSSDIESLTNWSNSKFHNPGSEYLYSVLRVCWQHTQQSNLFTVQYIDTVPRHHAVIAIFEYSIFRWLDVKDRRLLNLLVVNFSKTWNTNLHRTPPHLPPPPQRSTEPVFSVQTWMLEKETKVWALNISIEIFEGVSKNARNSILLYSRVEWFYFFDQTEDCT